MRIHECTLVAKRRDVNDSFKCAANGERFRTIYHENGSQLRLSWRQEMGAPGSLSSHLMSFAVGT